jgi:hypothetical protein
MFGQEALLVNLKLHLFDMNLNVLAIVLEEVLHKSSSDLGAEGPYSEARHGQ